MNNTRIFLRLAVAAFVLCLAASAQETSPITHVSLFKVKPARMAEWIKATHKNYVPVMDKLVADGTILAYGINTAVLHRAGLPNADAWFTVPDYGAYEKCRWRSKKRRLPPP
jgi:hypothetical protein